MPVKLTKYDPATDLRNPKDQADLIAEAIKSGDPKFIKAATDTSARADAHLCTRD